MAHNIWLTGASGYLGGTLLARLSTSRQSGVDKIFALVRKDAQAEACHDYGVSPLKFDAYNQAEVQAAIIENKITIVYFLIGANKFDKQEYFIQALSESKKITGQDTHFIFVYLLQS